MYQMDVIDWTVVFAPFLSVAVMLFLMMLTIACYMKWRYFLVMITLFLFSIVIGMISIAEASIPFTPWFQIFFMVFETIFFYLCTNNFMRL